MTSSRTLGMLAAFVIAAAAAAPSIAAEIVLEPSALQTIVVDSLFRNDGKYDLQRGACRAWLEQPTVSLREGRLSIRSRLAGQVGVPVGASCAGINLSTWTIVSGIPRAGAAVIRLTDVRIDDVDDANARALLNAGIVPSLPAAFSLDMHKAVQTMLQGAGGRIQAEVQQLTIESVRIDDNKLSIRFDFKLLGR